MIIIGNGSLLANCLKFACTYSFDNLKCIETEQNSFSNLKVICFSCGSDYLSLTNRKEISDFFLKVTKRTLVLSVHNSYIFSEAVLENKNLKIINFHNSLLPKHPGRNAPTWAIYDGDENAGITWHEVTHEIDKGDIIFQNTVLLNSRMTGIQLTKICVTTGFKALREIFPLIINNDYSTTPQQFDRSVKMHYSYEVPNDGILDNSWSATKASAFLRSIDYGVYQLFPKPKMLSNNSWFLIEHYNISVSSKEDIKINLGRNEEVCLQDNEVSVKLKLKPILN